MGIVDGGPEKRASRKEGAKSKFEATWVAGFFRGCKS